MEIQRTSLNIRNQSKSAFPFPVERKKLRMQTYKIPSTRKAKKTSEAPDKLTLATFIERFKAPITANIHKRFAPIYDLNSDTTAEDALIAQMQTRKADLGKPMFTAQEHVTKAAKKLLKDHKGKCVFVIGELGTGKTQIANSLTQIMEQTATRNLIICPPHLVKKWEREIRATMPTSTKLQVFQIRSISDFEKARKESGLYEKTFFIMSMERSKLSYYWKPSFNTKMQTVMNPDTNTPEIVEMPYCPKCKQIITDPTTGTALEVGKLRNKKHWCKHEYAETVQAGDNSFKEITRKCNTPLWTADREGPRRYALADYIAKRHKNFFDVFIGDEIQKFKSRNSAIGQVMGTLAGACKKYVGLTGTIFGGRSSSLFYLLYRFSPAFKKQFKYTDEAAFVKKYGIQWTIRKETETTEDGRSSKRKSSPVRIEEKPGISPEIILYLIDKAVFINLKDISDTLPPYEEMPIECQMTGKQAAAYNSMETAFKAKLCKALAKGDKRLLSVYLQTCLTFPDLPGEDPEEILPKEKALIDFILRERTEGRRTLVYCTHTDTRDVTPRLSYVLNKHGIKSEVMKSTVSAEKREDWIRGKVSLGLDALICNPMLVETGLDLIDFPNIVFFETSFNIYSTRQSSRRSWRIGQTQNVKVLFMCYKKTMQERALALVAKKLKAAEMLDGELQTEGLSGYQDEGSILVDLAKSMLSGIQEDQTLQGIFNSKATTEADTCGFIGHDEPKPPAAPEIPILTAPARKPETITQPDLWDLLYAEKLAVQTTPKPRQAKADELILRLF